MVLVNGIETDHVSVQDRGLHYGDGVFETLAVRDGEPLCWGPHLDRLRAGCQRLGIPCPDPSQLLGEARQVSQERPHAVLKLLVTRGVGGRGYRPPGKPTPSRVVASYPWPEYPRASTHHGVSVRVCDTRLGRNPSLTGIKHLNRLEQVLARAEWTDPDIAEGLMLDMEGQVIEGTMSNLFMVRERRLLTPELGSAGIPGIMRALIMESAGSMGLEVTEASLKLADLGSADELFLCNSIFGVWPIRRLSGKRYAIGPLSLRMRERLTAMGVIGGPA